MTRVLLVIVLSVSAVAAAGEQKVAEKDVPKAALDAVAKKYPGARRVGFQRERDGNATTYEVKLVDGARSVEVELSPAGKITAEEELVDIKLVPEVVRDALARSTRWGKWTVTKVERVIKNEEVGAPQYELHLAHDAASAEVVFDKNGALLSADGGGSH